MLFQREQYENSAGHKLHYILLNLLDLDHLSEKLILTGPSGTATSLVTALSAGPSCAILNLCTNFTIIMYNSSLANLCPMHALSILSQCSCCQGKPGAMTPGQVGERVSSVSLFAVSQPPFWNKLVGVVEVVGFVGHAVPHSDHHRALGHLVATYHSIGLHRKVKTSGIISKPEDAYWFQRKPDTFFDFQFDRPSNT